MSLERILASLAIAAGLVAGWGGTSAALAAAGPAVETERVEARLLAEGAHLVPGEPNRVALRLEMAPGWHTYWLNPGDSGEATHIDWILPEGVAMGPIEWPAPHRVPVGPLMNYGYEDWVLLPSQLTLPADWPAGAPVEIRAEATWLVCAEVCIPEQASLTLSLPTAAGPRFADPLWAPEFASTAAELPHANPWPTRVAASGDGRATLTLESAELAATEPADLYFFPAAWGLIEQAAPQPWRVTPEGLELELTLGATAEGRPLEGLLVIEDRSGERPDRIALAIEAGSVTAGAAGSASTVPSVGAGTPLAGTLAAVPAVGLWEALLFALLGGLILNLMPCVFPVLSMKALALVRQSGEERRHAARHGFAYTAGVLACFGAIGLALLALKSGGAALGWGFQLQSPPFVGILALVLFGLGLMLSGLVTVGGGFLGLGSELAAKPGVSGSFFTGVLAAVVATPCTAPFMGAAVGFALGASGPVTFAVLFALGLGLALPYLLASLAPGAIGRILPRPGPWMLKLQQFLAFPLYASAAWLVWVLGRQAGPDAVFAVLISMVLLGFGIWLLQGGSARTLRRAGASLAVAAALVLTLGVATTAGRPAGESSHTRSELAEGFWQPYSPARLEQALAESRGVFVNMTADWCITCLVNERVALGSETMRRRIEAAGIVPLLGDWTAQDPEITAFLERFGRSGVPLYVFFPPDGGTPEILPQLLTEALVAEALGLDARPVDTAETGDSPNPS